MVVLANLDPPIPESQKESQQKKIQPIALKISQRAKQSLNRPRSLKYIGNRANFVEE